MFYYQLDVDSDNRALSDLAVQELIYTHNLRGGVKMASRHDRARTMERHPSNGVSPARGLILLRPGGVVADEPLRSISENGNHQT